MDTSLLDQWDAVDGGDLGGITPYTPPTQAEMTGDTFSNPSTSAPGPSFGQVLGAGASVLGGIGAYMQGQEEAGADEYNASLALMQGQFNVEEIGAAEDETLSTQKAMYAKAGVELSGSVLDTAVSTATNYEYDKQVAEFNAQSEANMYNYEAKVAKSQGEMGLAEGLLSGAAKLF